MKATVEKLENNHVLLEVEVEVSKVQKALDQAYRRLVRQVNIPGFRKGKAPRFIFEQYVGKEPLYSEVVEIVIPTAYEEAVAEQKLEPINHPDIEIVSVEEGEPLVFKAKVEVKPEVQLGQYKGLELERPEVKITEADIDEYLKNLQNRYAELKVIEDETAVAGDILTIDFTGEVDGETHPGMQSTNYQLELGSGTFIPGFEEQLVGVRVNEERTVRVSFPSDYQAKDLAGKEAVFQVTVQGIKRKQLTPIDDEFAKDVSECDTLEELRQDVRRRLEERQQQEIEALMRRTIVKKAVDGAKVDVPEILVERRLDVRTQELERNFMAQGLPLEKLLTDTGKTMDDFRQDLQPQAVVDVKTELVLGAIARAENIEATQEDIDAEVEKMAKMFQQSPEDVRKNLGDLSFLKYDIMNKKVIEMLLQNSVFVPLQETKEMETPATTETLASDGVKAEE